MVICFDPSLGTDGEWYEVFGGQGSPRIYHATNDGDQELLFPPCECPELAGKYFEIEGRVSSETAGDNANLAAVFMYDTANTSKGWQIMGKSGDNQDKDDSTVGQFLGSAGDTDQAHLAIPTAGTHACKVHAVIRDNGDDGKAWMYRFDPHSSGDVTKGEWVRLPNYISFKTTKGGDFEFNADGVPAWLYSSEEKFEWSEGGNDKEGAKVTVMAVATDYPDNGTANWRIVWNKPVPPAEGNKFLNEYGMSLDSYGNTFYAALTFEKAELSTEEVAKTGIAYVTVPKNDNPDSAHSKAWTQYETNPDKWLPLQADHGDRQSFAASNSHSEIMLDCRGQICLAHVSAQTTSGHNL